MTLPSAIPHPLDYKSSTIHYKPLLIVMRRPQATVKRSNRLKPSNLAIYQSWSIRNFDVVELASFVLLVPAVSALVMANWQRVRHFEHDVGGRTNDESGPGNRTFTAP